MARQNDRRRRQQTLMSSRRGCVQRTRSSGQSAWLGLSTSTLRRDQTAARHRAVGGLRFEDRREISRGLAATSGCAIAAGLGRSPSAISRGVASNGGRAPTGPRPLTSRRGWGDATRGCKLATSPMLVGVVAGTLQRRWSPNRSPAGSSSPTPRSGYARHAREHPPLASRAIARCSERGSDRLPAHGFG
jgi:hypothetical protein